MYSTDLRYLYEQIKIPHYCSFIKNVVSFTWNKTINMPFVTIFCCFKFLFTMYYIFPIVSDEISATTSFAQCLHHLSWMKNEPRLLFFARLIAVIMIRIFNQLFPERHFVHIILKRLCQNPFRQAVLQIRIALNYCWSREIWSLSVKRRCCSE